MEAVVAAVEADRAGRLRVVWIANHEVRQNRHGRPALTAASIPRRFYRDWWERMRLCCLPPPAGGHWGIRT